MQHYRVVDLTDNESMIAGMVLADLGADVIAVEPPTGSPARTRGPFAGDEPGPIHRRRGRPGPGAAVAAGPALHRGRACGLFSSDDGGESWELNRPLWGHPTRGLWMMAVTSLTENVLGGAPAGDDLRIDPSDPDHMVAVVQSAGLFETNDGGASWEARQVRRPRRLV